MSSSVEREKILNVPNLLSGYRLLAVPVILYLAIRGSERVFVILICVSLVTDILDGLIARTFHLETRFGAALDNLADFGTYFVAIYGLFRFRWGEVRPQGWLLFLFLGMFLFSYAVALTRFRKIPGLHLYSCVSAGYLQGIFLFVLFAWGFRLWLYCLASIWGILAYTEKTIVLFLLDDITPRTKGLYWLIRKRRLRQRA